MITSAGAADAKTNVWESSIAASMALTSGNSETLMANLKFLTAKKWLKNELAFGADGTYGESEFIKVEDDPATPNVDEEVKETDKTAQSARVFGQYNRLFSEKFFGYARVEGLHDDIADIQYRFTFSPGAGYYFIKNQRTLLSGEIGPGYVIEEQGGESDDYITLRIAERFEYKISATAKLWQSLEFLPQVDDWENFIINAELGVETSLTKSFGLRAFIQDTYDNEPAPGRKENDLKVLLGIAYNF